MKRNIITLWRGLPSSSLLRTWVKFYDPWNWRQAELNSDNQLNYYLLLSSISWQCHWPYSPRKSHTIQRLPADVKTSSTTCLDARLLNHLIKSQVILGQLKDDIQFKTTTNDMHPVRYHLWTWSPRQFMNSRVTWNKTIFFEITQCVSLSIEKHLKF